MSRFRSILALVLVAMTVFLVSCGGAPVAKGPLYSEAQLEQIQTYAAGVNSLRDRFLELPPLVQKGDWTEVDSFLHGDLGELRARMARLARSLAPKDTQTAALDAAKEVFVHLNEMDEAVQTREVTKALKNYNAALKDFDAFLEFIPS
ncbi:MAG: photosystem II protein PsbQ [Oculatellaceae cyanobacterium Prado106]|nr:photosystem II protein PsbQ [Oculatellaceae cyanobacterium Prado106]